MKLSSRMIIIGLVSMLLLTSCATKEENADSKPTATIEATATVKPVTETTGTPDVTPTDGNEVTTSPTEDTTAQVTTPPVEETTAPETKSPVTTAPETTVPADDKVYASKEEYPDDWGISDGIIRAKGDIFFWEDSRVMHTAPKGIPGPERWHLLYPDEENDQFIFYIKKNKNEWDYYSFVKGKVYKLNAEKIIFNWNDDTGPIYWVEEDGTAKSFYVRSNKYDEVYIEAEGVKGYIRSLNSFRSMDGTELVKPNSEDILAKIQVVS